MAEEFTVSEEAEIKKKMLAELDRGIKMRTSYGNTFVMTDQITLSNKPPKQHMGLAPEHHKSHHVFPRQFRWTLEPKHSPGLKVWFRSMDLDIVNHTLKISMYETQTLDAEKWLRTLATGGVSESGDILTLTTYDGNGNGLYSMLFCKLRLREHKCSYDYAKSDVVTHEIVLDYGWYDKKIYRSSAVKAPTS